MKPIESNAPVSRQAVHVAAGFFLIAVLAVIAASFFTPWSARPAGYLAKYAASIGLDGLIISLIVRRAIARNPESAPPRFLEIWCTLSVFIAFLAFYGAMGLPETAYNEQTRQAVAFLQGHTYIDAPEHAYIEYAKVGAFKYGLQPPLAAIITIPLAALWGMNAPQTSLSVFIGALTLGLVWVLLGRFRLDLRARVWLTAFFGLGTCYWFDVITGNTWGFPMVVSVLFTVAALTEVFGKARPIWIGIFAGLAALARYELVLAWPAYMALAWIRGRTIKELLWTAPGFVAAALFFIGFNEARYHAPLDMGLTFFGPKFEPLFSPRYLMGNLYTLLFMAPILDGRFPYLHPTISGQALMLTSPAFVLAFRASFRRPATLLMWLAAAMCSVPTLLFFANGFSQFGTRLYVQIFPFLFVLVALGMRRRADQLTKVLIVVSIVLATFGIWHIRMYGYG